jgi:hypothetical protein
MAAFEGTVRPDLAALTPVLSECTQALVLALPSSSTRAN